MLSIVARRGFFCRSVNLLYGNMKKEFLVELRAVFVGPQLSFEQQERIPKLQGNLNRPKFPSEPAYDRSPFLAHLIQ